ncbi:hypothetical protein Noc_1580 [Nitrosococcus oceani ATCC 19707]|uniref:Uncharacterized protein n=2 Tax=Nitrosococcus oceani TaxID=1229 RepID=Q3JAT7_NITOC|nr:PD-(D/E)XK nuclease family protein [Nitrosococcus oceani]ABA58059.1 hypothetical protein Noc_1580 [Nitrosococcus oceani ATCC 19707]EDZ67726.1 hypothetical protein NOC27_1053 [Nitrosococcus oceani AFC27]KFI19499.1 hypothetical protein IB75_08345 [Nitrosococcus oceani C-27]GEM20970.1 hypothetical protein NONS58_23960 [Nitrosococcus oceani]
MTPLDEKTFEALQDEWSHVLELHKAARRKRIHARVIQWETRLSELKDEQKRLINSGRWVRGPADILSVIGKARRELYHSAILRWLLDPLSPHGLGIKFLRGFLQAAKLPPLVTKLAPEDILSIETEVARVEARADIVISTVSGLIIIENKIDASEGDNQCQRLFEAFRRENAWFIFLTSNGRTPSSAPACVRAHFRPISYRQIQRLLMAALESSPQGNPDAPGRASARSYLATLQKEVL